MRLAFMAVRTVAVPIAAAHTAGAPIGQQDIAAASIAAASGVQELALVRRPSALPRLALQRPVAITTRNRAGIILIPPVSKGEMDHA
jgi:hypothetical protein